MDKGYRIAVHIQDHYLDGNQQMHPLPPTMNSPYHKGRFSDQFQALRHCILLMNNIITTLILINKSRSDQCHIIMEFAPLKSHAILNKDNFSFIPGSVKSMDN